MDGAALRRARLAAGMTQADLARALGVAGPERISSWEHETNGPQVSQVPVLARVLQVGPEALLVSDARNRLRDLRWVAGLSLGELADQLHVGRNTYQRWETGERAFPDRPQVFRQLSAILGVPEEVVRHAVTGVGSGNLPEPTGAADRGGDVTDDVTGGADGLPRLAEQLNHLFATVPRSAGSSRPHSNETAAEALQQYGIRVTGHNLAHLRAGRRDNPSARLLAGIAQLFGVPIGYFFDEHLESEVNQQLATLVAARDTRLQTLMMRGVSPESLGQVEGILEQIRRLEGLEVVDEADGPAQ